MVQTQYFSAKDEFNASDGISFAVGLVHYDDLDPDRIYDSTHQIEDPSYGQVKLYAKGWGQNDITNGNFMQEIETQIC